MSERIEPTMPQGRPASDVSPWVGLAGLAGLFAWIIVCRHWPLISDTFGMPGPRARLDGPFAALAAMVFSTLPMVAVTVLVDKAHLRPSTGIDWTRKRSVGEASDTALVKVAGLWATWAIIAGFYALARWYWDGQYLFAMKVLGAAAIPLFVLAIPYVHWLDRYMVNPRDGSWHFGQMVLLRDGYDWEAVKKHWRAWIIKGFFGAFMISILPPGFQQVVNADFGQFAYDPATLGMALITLLFVIDVQIGTVGYIVTFRPLDAHIRSGMPHMAGWVAALLCYPPFGAILSSAVLGYEYGTPGRHDANWTYWLAAHPALMWLWAGLLVALTAIYAWATFAFGLRFSNLTYRGVLTGGPYRFTRHPAYLSKNLFWWCSTLPFLVSNGSASDTIRNTVALLLVNAIYFWRARTEEEHLWAEDPKYRAYHAYMSDHGAITAPLVRLKRKLGFRLRGFDSVPEPAE